MADVLDDDALLDADEGRDLAASDLDDDQIAVLLARDISDRDENVEMLEINGPKNTNAVADPIAQEVLLRPDADDEGFEEAPEAAIGLEIIEDDDVEEIVNSSRDNTGSSSVDGDVEEILEVNVQVKNNGIAKDTVLTLDDDDDDDVIEDYDASGEVEESSSGEGTSTRKRAGSSSSSKAPAYKRTRPDRPFLETRQKMIDAVSKIYGSWDATLNVSQLRVLTDMRRQHFDDIIDNNVKSEEDLKNELERFKEEHESAEKARIITRVNLERLANAASSMRGEVDALTKMVTQPPVTEQSLSEDESPVTSSGNHYAQARLQRHPSNMSSVSQQGAPHYQQALQQPQQRFYTHQGGVPGIMDQAARQQLEINRAIDRNNMLQKMNAMNGNIMVRGAPQQVHLRNPTQIPPRTPMGFSVPRANYSQPSAQPHQPKFQVVQRVNHSMGHSLEPSAAVSQPQELIDLTKLNDNWINLCVPLVATNLVISCGDCSRLPILPKKLSQLPKCPDISVTINSDARDVCENWQIGGRINYENMGALDTKTIKLYVQVGSLKAAGLHGKPDRTRPFDVINWGISNEWPCITKKYHKFRIQFHQKQILPHNDRVVVVAVVKNTSTGAQEVSEHAYINFG